MDPKKERQVVGLIHKTNQELNNNTFQALSEKLQQETKSKLQKIEDLRHSIYSAQARKLLARIHGLPKGEVCVAAYEKPGVVIHNQEFAVDQRVEMTETEFGICAGTLGTVQEIHLHSVRVYFDTGQKEFIQKSFLKILPSDGITTLSDESVVVQDSEKKSSDQQQFVVHTSPVSGKTGFRQCQRVKTIQDVDDKHSHIPSGTEGTIDSVFSAALLVQFDGFEHPTVLLKTLVAIVSNEITVPRTEQPMTHVVHHYPAPVFSPAQSNQNHIVKQSIHSERQGVEQMGRPLGSKNKKGIKGTKKSKKTRSVSTESDAKINDRMLQHLEHWMTMLVNGAYWSLTRVKQEKIIDQLNQIKDGADEHLKDIAVKLLMDIQQRLAVAETVQAAQQVSLRVTVDEKPAGVIGTVMSVINAKAHVRFDGDKKMTVVSKYLLDPVVVPTSQESAKDVTQTPSSAEELILPPTTVALVQSVENESSSFQEQHPDNEPLSELEVDAVEPVEDQSAVLPTDTEFVIDGSKALIVSPKQQVEERFPIKDHRFFVEGCIFAMQQGLMDPVFDLYYVLKATDHPEVRRVFLQCIRLNSNLGENNYHFEFPYPKRWFDSRQPRFFYPTQQEYFLLFSQHPFAHILPLTLKQFADVDEQYRQWLLSAMETAMSKLPHWTTHLDCVLGVADIMKHYFLDKQLFPVFIQHVFEDCETEAAVDGVMDRILFHLKNEEGEDLIVEDVKQAACQAKQRIHKAHVAESIRNLPFPSLTTSQMNEIESILIKIESINKSHT